MGSPQGALGRVLCLGALALVLLGGYGVPVRAAEVRVVADTLSVHAERASLQEILEQLQEAGIRIRVDARVNPLVTADFDARNLRVALEELLDDCDYALFSTLIEGPAGPLRRISEIDVYMRGDRRPLKPLPGAGENLARAQAPVRSNTIVCVKNEVLVRFKRELPPEALRNLLAQIGGTVVESIPALGIYRIRLVPGSNLADILKALAASPVVENAEPNLVYRPVGPTRVSDGQAATAGSAASSAGRGTAAVAVLDTGLRPGAGLDDRVVATLDAVVPDRPLADALGHGTQMAMIASGMTAPDGVGEGDAGGAPIIPIRAFDDNGYASEFTLMQSMMFALDHGARVVSMSWGATTDSGFLDEAIAYAGQRGAVLVAAAGNEPTGQPTYPAACKNVVAVAALTPDGNVWSSSNYGTFVTLAAPGVATFSIGYNGPPGAYAGTSVSTAFTANALARYFAIHPDADAQQAMRALNSALSHSSADTGRTHPEIGRLDSRALAAFLTP